MIETCVSYRPPRDSTWFKNYRVLNLLVLCSLEIYNLTGRSFYVGFTTLLFVYKKPDKGSLYYLFPASFSMGTTVKSRIRNQMIHTFTWLSRFLFLRVLLERYKHVKYLPFCSHIPKHTLTCYFKVNRWIDVFARFSFVFLQSLSRLIYYTFHEMLLR